MIDEYLENEIDLGRVVGPVDADSLPVQISRFGVKAYYKGKWRLILDLSHSEDNSMNDRIDPELCSVVHFGGPCGEDGGCPRKGCITGKAGSGEYIPDDTSPPSGQVAARDEVERKSVVGHRAAVWFTIGPQIIQLKG